ncbi:MAG: BrnA antitoxin family protein [Neisseriaceae bacterium]|nr:BrnA antitoxin family protein [Neisseriaceae bacterium]
MKEQIHDIDAMDNEDYAYYRGKTRDLSTAKWKTADEMPFIKAYQEKKGIRKPQRKKIISLRVDEDILTLLKQGGRGYQNRVNNILREYFKDSLAS